MSKQPRICDVCDRPVGVYLEDGVKLERVGLSFMQKFDGWSSSYEQEYDVCKDCWIDIGNKAKAKYRKEATK